MNEIGKMSKKGKEKIAMLKRIALFVAVIMILGISFPSVATASVSAQVTSFSPASGIYYSGNAVISSLSFKNTGTEKWTFWVGYSVQDKAGQWYGISSHSVTLNPGQVSAAQSKTWNVPTNSLLTTGLYRVVMAVWKTRPENGGAIRLANAEKADAFQAFNFFDNFASFDTNRWSKDSHNLGRSYLDPNNIDVSNGNLRIKIPANTLNGGEIESKNFYKYGTYRARMQLPNAPSSITGLFLYRSPDYYNEMDIEIYNDHNGNIMFTTYAGGRKTHTVTKNLGFDPTVGFHEYRFDFYPSGMSFYVDGKLLQSWNDGLTTNSMKLMVNTWFPNWLPGTKPTSTKYTLVDWIQH